MRIGIVGAGAIGSTLARLWVAAGHEVLLASRRPEGPRELASALGPSARAGSPEQAARFGTVVALCVPWPQLAAAVGAAGDLGGQVLVDTGNPFASPGGPVALPPGVHSMAEQVARLAPGARVVKAFNTLPQRTLAESGLAGERLAVPLSADDPDAAAVVADLAEDAGFRPVHVGSLAGATRQEPGGPLYDRELTAAGTYEQLRGLEAENLASARRFVAEVLGGQDRQAFTELVDPDVVVHSGMSPLRPMTGRDAFAAGLGSLAAFTFVDFTVEDLMAVEDRVVARYRAHADHTGDQLGVPATGTRVTMWEVRLMRWRQGRLVEDFVADINYDWPWLVAPAYPGGVGRTGLS